MHSPTAVFASELSGRPPSSRTSTKRSSAGVPNMAHSAKSFESALDAEAHIVIDPAEAATIATCSRTVAGAKRRNHLGVAGVAGVAGQHQERDQTPLLPDRQETEKFPCD